MNRYQFEDLVSDYIENQLKSNQRKQFDEYLEKNKDAQKIIDSVVSNISDTKKISQIEVKEGFNERLLNLIDKNAKGLSQISKPAGTIFGFTPISLSIMTIAMIAFLVSSYEIFSLTNPDSNLSIVDSLTKKNEVESDVNMQNKAKIMAEKNDSTSLNKPNKSKLDYSKSIKFVKD